MLSNVTVSKVILFRKITTSLVLDTMGKEGGGSRPKSTVEEDSMCGKRRARARETAGTRSWYLVPVKVKVVWLRATLPHDETVGQ